MSGEFLVTVGAISNLDGIFSGPNLKGCALPRIAMVGRSNVGKSSLINALVSTRVAQVSKEPGKTRSIHFYRWHEAKKVVADLPGYGYARTAQTERDRWAGFINAYLRADENLACAVVLLDARHGPTKLDEEAIRFLSFESIPVIFVFTKSDQLKTQSERVHRKRDAAEAIRALGYDPDGSHWVSSKSGDGLKKLAGVLSG